jgi:hypothetical protein
LFVPLREPLPDRTDNYIGPLLLGCDGREGVGKPNDSGIDDWKKLPKHGDEDQVQLDVDRSFIYYPTGRFPLLSHIIMN